MTVLREVVAGAAAGVPLTAARSLDGAVNDTFNEEVVAGQCWERVYKVSRVRDGQSVYDNGRRVTLSYWLCECETLLDSVGWSGGPKPFSRFGSQIGTDHDTLL